MKTLGRAAEIQPKSDEVYRAMASVEIAAGQMPKAINIARDLQKAMPKSAAGYVLEGDIYAAAKSWPQAVSAYRVAVSESQDSTARLRLYTALVSTDHAREAERLAAGWLKTYPEDDELRARVAGAAARNGDHATAMRHYAFLVSRRPNDIVALNNAAWNAAKLGDGRALEYAERAHQLSPRNAEVNDTLGMLLVNGKDAERGIQLLRQAVDLDPRASEIRLNLARALIKVGEKDSARKELDELAKLGNQYAQQAEVARLRSSL